MENFYRNFKNWIEENRLLVIEVTLRKQGRKTFLGRMVQFNQKENSLLIYNDDTKSIEHLILNEIDEISPSETTC